MNVKHTIKSKTLWVQGITFAAALVSLKNPIAGAWLASNPEQVLMAFAALNSAVRFFTSTRLSFFSDSDKDSGSSPFSKTGLSSNAVIPAFVCACCTALAFGLVSCSAPQYRVNGGELDWVTEPVQVLDATRVTPIFEAEIPDELGGGVLTVPLEINQSK